MVAASDRDLALAGGLCVAQQKAAGPPTTRAQAADDLRTKILNGRYPPGSVLPSSRELRERYLIGSDSTLDEVYRILKSEGGSAATPP